MTESFNVGGTFITVYGNSFIFWLLPFLLKIRLSRVVFCENLDDCWRTKDSWGGLMTELFNVRCIYITGYDNSLLFQWLSLILKHRLSWWVVCCLPLMFPVPLLWQLTIPFGRGMMSAIWVCGGVVCLFFFVDGHKRWEPTFFGDNCSRVWVSVPEIKLITSFFSQYDPN